jgi:ElaB/YqjD/DUF883 family membrane-anchored ribosome-binding protein
MAQDVFSSMGESAGRMGETAGRKAQDVADAASRKVQEVADRSREKWDEVKKRSLEDVFADTREWVRMNPGKTLVGALAAGWLIGRILRRR